MNPLTQLSARAHLHPALASPLLASAWPLHSSSQESCETCVKAEKLLRNGTIKTKAQCDWKPR